MRVRRRSRAFLAAFALTCSAVSMLLAAPARADEGPLSVRDANPWTRAIYLPLPGPAPAEGWQFGAALLWSNTVNLGQTDAEAMIVDAESAEVDFALTYARGPWRFRAGLPVHWRGGGVLDGFISGWHDVFGLPDGDRPKFPRNRYDVRYRRTGQPVTTIEEGTALGDLRLEAGRVVAAGARGELAAWFGAELPTGDASRGAGNDGVDVAAWLAGRTALGERLELSGQAGVVAPGGDGPLPVVDAAGFGTIALGWRFGDRFTAIAQFDAHTGFVPDTDLKFLGAASVLTLGGRVRFASGAVFEAGVSEDVPVERSPDVAFHFAFRWPAFR